MGHSNYRGDWARDRDERGRSLRDWDEDDSRRAMESDYYGGEFSGRGGYGGQHGQEGHGQRYNRGYGQGDYDRESGQRESGRGARHSQSGRLSESGYGRGREFLGGERRHHYGNETGGWQGREEEQWRNRDVHGQYDREANYGGFSGGGTGNYRGYGGSGGSYQGGQGRWGEFGQGGSQGDYNYRGYERGRERYGQQRYGQGQGGDYRHGQRDHGRSQGRGSGSAERPSGYLDDESISPGQGLDQWGTHQGYGAHRGRGPRGYKRSDDRIREEVCDCLTDDDSLDATNIEVSVKDGEVTLSGYTTSREDKRWAESLVERISGVKEVQNNLRLQDRQRAQAGAQSSQGATGTSSTGMGRTGDNKGRDSNIQH